MKSICFKNEMPDRFVDCHTSGQQLLNERYFQYGRLTSGQQLLNEQCFQYGGCWPSHCEFSFCLHCYQYDLQYYPENIKLMNRKQNVLFDVK